MLHQSTVLQWYREDLLLESTKSDEAEKAKETAEMREAACRAEAEKVAGKKRCRIALGSLLTQAQSRHVRSSRQVQQWSIA